MKSNATCLISRMPIYEGDPVIGIVLASKPYPSSGAPNSVCSEYSPVMPILHGDYNGNGGIIPCNYDEINQFDAFAKSMYSKNALLVYDDEAFFCSDKSGEMNKRITYITEKLYQGNVSFSLPFPVHKNKWVMDTRIVSATIVYVRQDAFDAMANIPGYRNAQQGRFLLKCSRSDLQKLLVPATNVASAMLVDWMYKNRGDLSVVKLCDFLLFMNGLLKDLRTTYMPMPASEEGEENGISSPAITLGFYVFNKTSELDKLNRPGA